MGIELLGISLGMIGTLALSLTALYFGMSRRQGGARVF